MYIFIIIIGKFEVNSSGLVITNGGLDSDAISQYNLTIEARDGGMPAKLTTVSL